MRRTGFREAVDWKAREMRFHRTSRHAFSSRPVRCRSPSRMPPSTWASLVSPRRALAMVDFPEPDSPRMPRH
jgi:hypothetical protein